MPRPRPGYVRPNYVTCAACGAPVWVDRAGRIPDRHPECATLVRAIRRAVDALEKAITARMSPTPEELRALRKTWAELQSSGNIVWNRVDNPAKRGGSK